MSDISKSYVKLGSLLGAAAVIVPVLYWLIAGNMTAANAEKVNDLQEKKFERVDGRFDAQTVILMDIKNDITAIKTELRIRRGR